MLEFAAMFSVLLYSLFVVLYLLSHTLLCLLFLLTPAPFPLDYLLICLSLPLLLAHYNLLLVCLTSTRRLLSISLFKKLPLYARIRDMGKAYKIVSVMAHFAQITYVTVLLKSYYDPRKKELNNAYSEIQRTVIGALIYVNIGQFLNQVLITFLSMILLVFYICLSAVADNAEEFDSDNQDDFFAFLEQRIEELKFKYGDLEKQFARRRKQIPRLCIICFEDFEREKEVIQLSCNKNHIYHQKCLFEWLGKNKTCPLCR